MQFEFHAGEIENSCLYNFPWIGMKLERLAGGLVVVCISVCYKTIFADRPEGLLIVFFSDKKRGGGSFRLPCFRCRPCRFPYFRSACPPACQTAL